MGAAQKLTSWEESNTLSVGHLSLPAANDNAVRMYPFSDFSQVQLRSVFSQTSQRIVRQDRTSATSPRHTFCS
jgi:hypothetical protein